MIRVSIQKDDSGHNYVIPLDKVERFNKLLWDEPDEELFITEFEQYSTGGDVNLVELYADIE